MSELDGRPGSAWYRVPSWVPVGLLVAYAAVVRVPGLTRTQGLFRDDAWMALSAQVPLSQAIHMLVSAPGYILTLRWWLGLRPLSTPWGQAPALFWSLLGVLAIVGLVRLCRLPRWTALTVGAVLAASPVAIDYSVRFKPYAFELVAAAGLLALTELLRRSWSRGLLLGMVAASCFTVASSLSLAPVVAGCWLALAVLGWREQRVKVLLYGLAAALLSAPVAIATALSVPKALAPSWSHFMLSPLGSPPPWSQRVKIVLGGFLHGIMGTPRANLSAGMGFAVFALVALVFAALLILGVVGWSPEALAPGLVLAVALGLCLLGQLPLGTGRTDEVLYPAVLLLLAIGLGRAWTIAQNFKAPREFASAVLAALVMVVVIGGATNYARYPAQREGALYAEFRPFLKPGQVIVVDPKASFTWAYQQLSGWEPVLSTHYLTGFAVRSTQPDVLLVSGLAPTQREQLQAMAARLSSKQVVWYVGIAGSVFSPSFTFNPKDKELTPSPTWYHLLGMGFRPSYRFSRPGAVAVLMVR